MLWLNSIPSILNLYGVATVLYYMMPGKTHPIYLDCVFSEQEEGRHSECLH